MWVVCVCVFMVCLCRHTVVFSYRTEYIGHYHTIVNLVSQGFRSSSAHLSVGVIDIVRHVDAKYPALLFKQQLIAYVEKIYGIIRDNVKKDLSPLLSSCIQVE